MVRQAFFLTRSGKTNAGGGERLMGWRGVNSQRTLPFGSVEEVAHEAAEVSHYMVQDGGYVFCNIHNILAEIPPEKIIAMYRAA